MHVRSLALADFRSYEQVDVTFPTGVTTLIGSNGQGKTNLVEAVVYVATQGSHRVATDAPLVRQGANRAVVRCEVARSERTVTVELEIVPGRANRARVNRSDLTRARDALGILRAVAFSPEDLAVVKGDPGERRRFLDDVLVQRQPRFAAVRSDVERVLKQRNSLLKSASVARGAAAVADTLDVWDDHLARAGAELALGRLQLLDGLVPLAGEAYATLAGRDALDLAYQASWSQGPPSRDRDEIASAIRLALRDARRDEIDRGLTLVGPQRDDVVMTVAGLPLRGYASHGESWSAALALRLASYGLLAGESEPGDDPVLILDDVFAELDADRRRHLASYVSRATQVLVTAAVAADVPRELEGHRLSVTSGRVTDA